MQQVKDTEVGRPMVTRWNKLLLDQRNIWELTKHTELGNEPQSFGLNKQNTKISNAF